LEGGREAYININCAYSGYFIKKKAYLLNLKPERLPGRVLALLI
jgi:hypothetical protein